MKKKARTARNEQLISLWLSNEESWITLQEVADEFSVTRERVRQILKEYGYNAPRSIYKSRPELQERDQKILAAYQKDPDRSLSVLAEEFDTYFPIVIRILRRAGIDAVRRNKKRRDEHDLMLCSTYVSNPEASPMDISRSVGVESAIVYRILRRNNLLLSGK